MEYNKKMASKMKIRMNIHLFIMRHILNNFVLQNQIRNEKFSKNLVAFELQLPRNFPICSLQIASSKIEDRLKHS